MDSEKKQVNAIHEKDLEGVIRNIGLWQKLEGGELKCKFCKTTITLENLYSIIPESGMFNTICDRPECIAQLNMYLSEKSKNQVDL